MESSSIFDAPSSLPSVDDGQEIISYEPVRAIAWSKLVKDRIVKIVTFRGEIGWSDGFMLEVAEVPKQLSKIKDFIESRRDDPINADNLAPELDPDDPITVEPLCTIKSDTKGFPDIVYLSNLHSPYAKHYGKPLAEVTIDKKYVDYFVKCYPAPWRKFIMKAKDQPVTVKSWKDDKIVGLIMPIFVEPALIERCRNFMQPGEPPYEPPVQPPPGERPRMSVLEGQYSIKQLQEMARNAGMSPVGDKKRLIKELQRAGKL